MKIKILIAVLFLYGVSAYGQNRYAYLPEGKVSFKVANHEIFIGYKNKLLKDNIFVIKELLKNKTNLTTDLGAGTQKITLDKTINQDTISSLILKLRNDTNILYANPFLIYKNGVRQGIDNKIILRPKDAQVINNLKKLFPKLGIVTIEKRPFITNEYLITIANKKLDALDAANTLYESNLFEYCEPNFIILGVFSTTDPLFAYQWALENTGSAIQYDGLVDADMDVTEAWLYNTGSTNIKIAVLDQGVELNHEDLINNLLPGYDALGLGSNGGNGVDSFHGTACAGIIAASGNNGLGVAGVAYTSKIVPVRISNSGNLSYEIAATAINWAAANNNADVISCSWGRVGSTSAALNTAILNAVTNGRNGKGTPVLFAAGNDNNSVSYPASNPLTIAVGASTMCNTRKRSSSNPSQLIAGVSPDPNGVSCDEENWWGSNYGAGLDVMAPGVKIATTDISGAAGYDLTNYTKTFNGTSAACPNAAGVMALILSVNPNLTQVQARKILESSTDKISAFSYNTYPDQPNGTWTPELGYGRVNAFKAVVAAMEIAIVGPDLICTLGTFTIPNLPPGATVTWSVSPALASISTSGNTATLTKLADGAFTLTAVISVASANATLKKEFLVPEITITASGGNCSGGTAMVNIPSGNTFTWTANGDINLNGQGQTLVTTSNIVNFTGTNGYINVAITGCSNPISKVYSPYSRNIIVFANPMLNSDPLSALIQDLDYPFSEIKWYLNNTQIYNMMGSGGSLFDTGNPPCGNHILRAEAVLTCGTTVEVGSVEIERYCSSWFRYYTIYPNPASANLYIAPDESKMNTMPAFEKARIKEYEISLFDIKGKLWLKKRSTNYKIELDTKNMPSDNYFLHIRMDGEKEVVKKQIIIKN